MERSKTELIGAMRQNEAKKYPLYQKLEAVASKMKKIWSDNAWILLDKSAMAVLEEIRKEHEEKSKKMQHEVDKAKLEAHNELELRFDAVHDKKMLRLQLHSMEKEYAAIQEVIKLKNNGQRK